MTTKTPPRTLVNASSVQPYKPPVWQPARANANQHLQVKSLGVLAGKSGAA